MPSLTARVEQLNNRCIAPVAAKSAYTYFGGFNDGIWSGIASAYRHHRLPDDRYGYALCYLLVPDLRACVDFYAQRIASIPYALMENDTYDPVNDKEVGRSDDVKPRHVFQEATRRHRRRYKSSVMLRLAYEYIMFDEMYTELIYNSYQQVSDLRVLNGLSVYPNEQDGEIISYMYTGDRQTDFSLPPERVAYDKGYNPLDDWRGASLLQTAIDSINVLRSLVDYVNDFFDNNARPGMVVSPAPQAQNVRQEQIDDFRQQLRDFTKGRGKQHTGLATTLPLNVALFENPDLQKQFSLHPTIAEQIYRAFRLDKAAVGDKSSTAYKDEWYSEFVRMQLAPHLRNIEEYTNDAVLPKMAADTRLVFDVSAYDTATEGDQRSADIQRADLQAGGLTLAEFRRLRGYDELDSLDDAIMIEGVPVPLVEAGNVWRMKYAAPATLDFAQAEEAQANADGHVVSEEAAEDTAKAPVTDVNGTPVPTGEVFGYHIDSGIVDINEARAQLGLPPIDKDETNDLATLRNQLATAREAIELGISKERAAELVGLAPNELENAETEDDQPEIASLLTTTAGAKQKTSSKAAALDELKAWRTKTLRKGASVKFDTEHLDDATAALVRQHLDTVGDDKQAIADVFDGIKARLDVDQAEIFADVLSAFEELGFKELIDEVNADDEAHTDGRSGDTATGDS